MEEYRVIEKLLLEKDSERLNVYLNYLAQAFLIEDFGPTMVSPDGTKNLWQHIRKVCINVSPERIVRWAALYHDVGKPASHSANDYSIFAGHALVGARIWHRRARLVGMPEERADEIETIIRYHTDMNQYNSDWSDRAVRKLRKKYGEVFDQAIELAIADGMPEVKARELVYRTREDNR